MAGQTATRNPLDQLLQKLTVVRSSRAKNHFRELIDQARREAVLITRNDRPEAVVLSVEEYERLVRAAPNPLATLEARFDEMLARMQTPEHKAGVESFFDAAPEELGASALAAAKRD